MTIKVIKTIPVTMRSCTIYQLINQHIETLSENSILVITSKVVALCEGRSLATTNTSKQNLIRQESEYWLPMKSKYGITLTIKGGRLIPTAGVDESNASGQYVLWPKNPYVSAGLCSQYLRRRFSLKNVGVIITDSTTAPLRLGTAGIAIAYDGFVPLKNYVGTSDIFGRKLEVTRANIVDALAAAAVVVMGEGNEQTPLATITEIPFVEFSVKRANPQALKINIADDLYAPLLQGVQWHKGGRFGKVN